MSAAHEFSVTTTRLADGRELFYFDDEPQYCSGERVRELKDTRDLPLMRSSSDIRRDPLTGQWVAYAAHRMNRTFMPPANENPLAPTKPGQLPTEIPADDYNVVVFQNRFPSLNFNIDPVDYPEPYVDGNDLYPQAPAKGRCEVVCFTPEPTKSFRELGYTRARTVVEAWAHRTKALSELPGVKLVFPFENRGEEIGVTLQHPHGQIYAYPYLPARAQQVTNQAKAYYEKTGGNLFTSIIEAEKESGRRVLVEGKHFLVFVPAVAAWPVEVMMMAKREDAYDFSVLTDEEKEELTHLYLKLLNLMDRFFDGVDRTPYISAWNQAPIGEDRPHGRLYLQLFSIMRSAGRLKFLAGSESGMAGWISDTTPERIADRFRELMEK